MALYYSEAVQSSNTAMFTFTTKLPHPSPAITTLCTIRISLINMPCTDIYKNESWERVPTAAIIYRHYWPGSSVVLISAINSLSPESAKTDGTNFHWPGLNALVTYGEFLFNPLYTHHLSRDLKNWGLKSPFHLTCTTFAQWICDNIIWWKIPWIGSQVPRGLP